MSEFWTSMGTIEALGNMVVNPDHTIYSVVRIRDQNGKMTSITNVMFCKQCDPLIGVNAKLSMVGFRLENKLVVLAVHSGGDDVNDLDAIQELRRGLQKAGKLSALICLVTCWSVVIPLVLAIPTIKLLKNASSIPSLESLEAAIDNL